VALDIGGVLDCGTWLLHSLFMRAMG
jgi:hypothetical protein